MCENLAVGVEVRSLPGIFSHAQASTVCCDADSGVLYSVHTTDDGCAVALRAYDHELTEVTLDAIVCEKLDPSSDAPVPICAEFIQGLQAVCIALLDGDVLLFHPSTQESETIGAVESGIAAVGWCPDQQLCAVVTGCQKLSILSSSFQPIAEATIQSDEMHAVAEASSCTAVSVGEGGHADDSAPCLAWNVSAEWLVTSTVESGKRIVRVWNRHLQLLATVYDSGVCVGRHLCCRPPVRQHPETVAVSKCDPGEDAKVLFFKQTGNLVSDVTVHEAHPDLKILGLQWNVSGNMLAVWLNVNGSSQVQVWLASATNLVLKQSFSFPGGLRSVRWDVVECSTLHIVTQAGEAVLYHVSTFRPAVQGTVVALVEFGEILLADMAKVAEGAGSDGPTPQYIPTKTPAQYVCFAPNVETRVAFVQAHEVFIAEPPTVDLFNTRQWSVNKLSVTAVLATVLPEIESALLRHLCWLREDLLAAAFCVPGEGSCDAVVAFSSSTTQECADSMLLWPCGSRVQRMFVHQAQLVAEFVDGSLWCVDVVEELAKSSESSSRLSHTWPSTTERSESWHPWLLSTGLNALPEPCSQLEVVVMGAGVTRTECMAALSPQGNFYLDHVQTATHCQAFVVLNNFVIIHRQKKCYFLPRWHTLADIEQTFDLRVAYHENLPEEASSLVDVLEDGTCFYLDEADQLRIVQSSLLQAAVCPLDRYAALLADGVTEELFQAVTEFLTDCSLDKTKLKAFQDAYAKDPSSTSAMQLVVLTVESGQPVTVDLLSKLDAEHWKQAMVVAAAQSQSDAQVVASCFAERCKQNHMWKDAAELYDYHLSDPDAAVECLLAGGYLLDAMRLCRQKGDEHLERSKVVPAAQARCHLLVERCIETAVQLQHPARQTHNQHQGVRVRVVGSVPTFAQLQQQCQDAKMLCSEAKEFLFLLQLLRNATSPLSRKLSKAVLALQRTVQEMPSLQLDNGAEETGHDV